MEYLAILIVLFLITLILERTHHVHLYRSRRERFEIVGLFFIVGVVWDSFAIWRGHWIFPADKTLGITIGNMPLEEYLFILVLPYFVLTVYKIIDGKFRTSKTQI